MRRLQFLCFGLFSLGLYFSHWLFTFVFFDYLSSTKVPLLLLPIFVLLVIVLFFSIALNKRFPIANQVGFIVCITLLAEMLLFLLVSYGVYQRFDRGGLLYLNARLDDRPPPPLFLTFILKSFIPLISLVPLLLLAGTFLQMKKRPK